LLSKDLDLETAKDPQLDVPRYFRYVDPLFHCNGDLCRLTDKSPKYKRIVEKHRRAHRRGVKVNLVNNRPLLKRAMGA
jgi:hypothetical protein